MTNDNQICECGHVGGMHTDEEYTHTGNCIWMLENGDFCSCKEFKLKEEQGKEKGK